MMHRRYNDSMGVGQQNITAVVKWYNATKGFGFVQPSDGSPDAFLHVSTVEQSGHDDFPEGTVLLCDISEGRKGPQVAIIHRVESMGTRSASPRGMHGGASGGATSTVEGTVKFFNAEKGFGFVTPDDGGKDVYVSVRTLERAGMGSLQPNQRVRLTTRMGQKGPMADSVEVI